MVLAKRKPIKNTQMKRLAIYNIDRFDIIAGLFVVLVGLVVRLIGFNWDGGHMIFQPDENQMVLPALYFARKKSLYPVFNYPAQFFSKFQAVVIWLYAKINHTPIRDNMIEAYLLCRIVTAVVGALTIIVIFLIGNYMKKRWGTLSAVLLAISPMMVNMSKQVTGDVTSLFLTSLVMLFSLRYTEKCEKRYLVLMAICAGMATMEKWHGGGAAAFIGVLIILYAKSVKDFFLRGIIALATYIASIIVIAPNLVSDIQEVIRNFVGTAVYDGGSGVSYWENLLSYCNSAFLGFGIAYILLAVLGLVFVLLSRDKRYVVLLPGVIKVAMLSVMNRSMPRWGLELYFSCIILVSFALCCLWNNKKVLGKCLALITGTIVMVESMLSTVFVNRIATAYKNDIRNLQEEFCSETGIDQSNSIASRYTAFFPGGIRADGEIPVPAEHYEDKFMIIDGQLYRLQDVDYFVWSSRHRVPEIKEALDNKELCIWEESVDYGDVFNMPWTNAGKRKKVTRNDLTLCMDYLRAIEAVNGGAIIGAYSIAIYDISSIPLAE